MNYQHGLQALAPLLNGQLSSQQDATFTSVSIDSRSLEAGALFVALSGAQFDGHDYVAEVAQKGAQAALVERFAPSVAIPQLKVANTRLALGQLGRLHRAAYQGPVAAVTGSSGKTTVKEMLAQILRLGLGGEVLATQGNLNNDLGAPLTLLRLAPTQVGAVIELGANHVGEIAYTVGLTQPQVAILTNAGNAHVGEFGGVANIIKAKGEIIDGLSASGVAVLNQDDPAFEIWCARAQPKRILSFSCHNPAAAVYASAIALDARGCPGFMLHLPTEVLAVQLNLLGTHNVANALASAAAAVALKVSGAAIVKGLAALKPVAGRGVVHLLPKGLRVIDDSYNANPAAVCAAIDLLAGFSGRRVLVLGDMGELGAWAAAGHSEVGAYARTKIDTLHAVGPLMRHAVTAFGTGAQHYADQQALLNALALEQTTNTTVLIKGSRSAAMERVVQALCPLAEETH